MKLCWSYKNDEYIKSKAIAEGLYRAIVRLRDNDSEENRESMHLYQLIEQLPLVKRKHINMYFPESVVCARIDMPDESAVLYKHTLLTMAARFAIEDVFKALLGHPKIDLCKPCIHFKKHQITSGEVIVSSHDYEEESVLKILKNSENDLLMNLFLEKLDKEPVDRPWISRFKC
ncbi:MAG TPA: hypothetical protein VLH77_05630 [Gammaproteobacteria bacterium]|nr:hypothetical protein [Gammaproteobacteria bacterium]